MKKGIIIFSSFQKQIIEYFSDMIEIERKFLVKSEDFKLQAYRKTQIKQGFLNSHKNRTVRVRLREDSGLITIKGISSENGLSRYEWETEISKKEALALLEICEPGTINKVRYEVKINNHIFEVDEFLDDNAGLVIAEIELRAEDEYFEKPNWLGQEVTGQEKYYNSILSKKPFNTW